MAKAEVSLPVLCGLGRLSSNDHHYVRTFVDHFSRPMRHSCRTQQDTCIDPSISIGVQEGMMRHLLSIFTVGGRGDRLLQGLLIFVFFFVVVVVADFVIGIATISMLLLLLFVAQQMF